MTVKERIREFIKYKGLSERKFCLSIDVSAAFVNSIVKSIQPDKVERIALQYPELNITWLLTGKGEMINTPEDFSGNSEIKDDRPSIPAYVLDIIKDERKSHDVMNQELLKQNSILIEQQNMMIGMISGQLEDSRKTQRETVNIMIDINSNLENLKAEISANKKETAHPDDLAECAGAER